ncbi:MAG TPA: peptidylprolyl isomerase [Candidatus Dormibacteraeota bacterium]
MHERAGLPPKVIDPCQTYVATVNTARGSFTVRLDRGEADPITTNNFVFLSQHAYYNHLTFHRVEDFVVQGGDPTGSGSGGPGYVLPNESNDSTFARGTVAMASNSQGVNGSQFFVLKKDSQYLSGAGQFNPFGEVISGMDVVDQIQVGDQIVGIDIAS